MFLWRNLRFSVILDAGKRRSARIANPGKGGRLCPPGRNAIDLTKIPGESVCTHAYPVGADVHIGPADYTVFTEIFGEFVTSQRADVGIGPYNQASMCIRIRRGFLRKRAAFSGRTESSAPTGTARVSPPGRRCRGRRNSLQTAAEAAGLRPEQTGSRPQARRCRLPPGRKGPRR